MRERDWMLSCPAEAAPQKMLIGHWSLARGEDRDNLSHMFQHQEMLKSSRASFLLLMTH